MQRAETASSQMRTFISDYEREMEPLAKQAALAHWQLQLQSSVHNQQAAAEAAALVRMVLADKAKWNLLRNIDANALEDTTLLRQHTLLATSFRINQLEADEIAEMEELRSSLSARYNMHRAKMNGEECSDNHLDEILANSQDSLERQRAWEASKTVGEVAEEQLLDLVRLRNRCAVKLGYRNYYEMALDAQEIRQEELSAVLKDLEDGCRPLWVRFRNGLDAKLAAQFAVSPSELMPWHHSNRFFQTVKQSDINLDEVYTHTDAVETTRTVFQAMGLPVDDLLARADLYERVGKCQHAFCLNVDRKGDIRVLCNITPGERWLTTTLHEFGHAVYDKFIKIDLPYVLRRPSHAITTEAVALFMGRLPSTSKFMATFSGRSEPECSVLASRAEHGQLTHQLVFLHWCMVMTHFERELYSNPGQDLNNLWWDLVEHYQRIKRPPHRNKPDWAAKIHFASSPVYYHSYLLGEMAASQITRSAVQLTSSSVRNLEISPAVGNYLQTKLFNSGATLRWDRWVAEATGSPLSAASFVNDLHAIEGTR